MQHWRHTRLAGARLHGQARPVRQLLRQRPAAPRGLAHVGLQRARDHRKCCCGNYLRQRRLWQCTLSVSSVTW